MSDRRETEALIESALTAWRPRAPEGRILAHPAWADMTGENRQRLFDDALATRWMEQALDPEGLSTTARNVLRRILPGRRDPAA